MGCCSSSSASAGAKGREQRRQGMGNGDPPTKKRSASVTGAALFERETSTVNEVMVQLHVGQNIRKVYSGLDPVGRKRTGKGKEKQPKNWLGAGNFGSVRVVTRLDDGRKFACKILRLSKHMSQHRRKELLAEVTLLAKMDHPHIAKLFETYEEESLNLYLVMELLEGGELFKRLTKDSERGHFTENEARHATHQMVSAIAYLHSKGIVHRDLKLENFVYREQGGNDLVLIDFGLSVKYNGNRTTKHLTDLVGSSYYIAPEVLKRNYGIECDMWSIGVIVFMLLSGTPPFKGHTENEIMASACKGTYSMNRPIWKQVSNASKDFVRRCLIKDVKVRMTAKQALEHVWLAGDNNPCNHDTCDPDVREGGTAKLDDGMIKSLLDYSRSAEFKRIALQAVAYSLSHDEIKKLGDAFELLDKDRDGYISYDELASELQNHKKLSDSQCKEIFDAIDFDRTGRIHFNEFIAAVLNESHYHDETVIRHAFDSLDINHDGLIDVQQLTAMFKQNDKVQDSEYVSELVKENATAAGLGSKLSPAEFLGVMRQAHFERLSSVNSQPALPELDEEFVDAAANSEHKVVPPLSPLSDGQAKGQAPLSMLPGATEAAALVDIGDVFMEADSGQGPEDTTSASSSTTVCLEKS